VTAGQSKTLVRGESSVSTIFYRGKLPGKHFFKVTEISRPYLKLIELKVY